MSEPPEAPGKRPRVTLKTLGDWASSIQSIIALVVVVGGLIGAIVSNHFTGWITGGGSDGAPTEKQATIVLKSRTPTSQDDEADTYTLVVRFQGHGKTPCTLTWQRLDSANAPIDPTPESVACHDSGRFQQEVRVPVPQRHTDFYVVRFRLLQGTHQFDDAVSAQQFIP